MGNGVLQWVVYKDHSGENPDFVTLAKGHSRRLVRDVYDPPMVTPKHRTPTAWFLGFLAAGTLLPAVVCAQPPQPLTTLTQVREAKVAVGDMSQRVKLAAVVIQETIQHDGRITVQNPSGGCTVLFPKRPDGSFELPPGLVKGQRVLIEGYATPGEFANCVMLDSPSRLVVLGPGEWPKPTLLTRENILSGACDSMFVEVRGVVRTAPTESKPWACEIACEGLRVSIESGQFSAAMVDTGAQVRAQGICFAIWNSSRQLVDMRVISGDLDLIEIVRPPPERDDIPLLTSRQLFTAGRGGTLEDRVKVQGVVLHQTPDGVLFLRDTDGGLRIERTSGGKFQTGDLVEVLGFPQRGELTPFLEDAEVQHRSAGPPPPAHPLAPEQFLADSHEADLVAVEGVVLDASSGPDGGTLLLQCGPARVTARLGPPAIPPKDSLKPGSRLRLTGISVLQPDRMRQIKDLGLLTAESLTLLLRRPADIEVLEAAPWWTLPKALAVLGGVSLLALMAGAWATLLRRQVAEQTSIISSKVRRETLHEDRLRIARELHDTLDQELLGISLHLDAAEKVEDLPEHARQSVDIARKLIHRSRAETKRTVWELRGGNPAELGLPTAIKNLLDEMRSPDGPKITFEATGDPTSVPQPMALHLLRIAQEALSNAIKHADACHILVRLDISETAVTAHIRDDGRGFDPRSAPRERSFGLLGMRERANKIQAKLELRSEPGTGTEILLHAPFPAAQKPNTDAFDPLSTRHELK